MNKELRQYFLVGIFVVVMTIILTCVWVWFLSSERQSYNIFLAVFNESVDGITTNSLVKYNGVEVGKVKSIKLDESNPHNILVQIKILENIPVNIDTFATIKPQGITGLSYIEMVLSPKSNNSKNIIPHNSEPFPQIKTQASFLHNLSEQAQYVTDDIKDVSEQIKDLLNKKNLSNVANILSNLEKISTGIANRSDNIDQALITLTKITSNLNEGTKSFNHTLQNVNVLTNNLIKTTNTANDIFVNIQQNSLSNFNNFLLPNLNSTMEHINQSTYQLEQLLMMLNDNPSALIRGVKPQKLGPNETTGAK